MLNITFEYGIKNFFVKRLYKKLEKLFRMCYNVIAGFERRFEIINIFQTFLCAKYTDFAREFG